MLIVITKDPVVPAAISILRKSEGDNWGWGRTFKIKKGCDQKQAETQIEGWVSKLKPQENLCLVGHGDKDHLGGSNEGIDLIAWTPDEVGNLLKSSLPENWTNSILIRSCGEDGESFASGLSAQLDVARPGISVFGYTKEIIKVHKIPNPNQLEEERKNGELVEERTNPFGFMDDVPGADPNAENAMAVDPPQNEGNKESEGDTDMIEA
ncbi:hypothetical protein KFE98_08100 [bacterium SCSIO 12741]|nr:hypothetical protein KFE98_08100 [bacterium SCSIO 12741]